MNKTIGILMGTLLTLVFASSAVFAAPDAPQSQDSPQATVATSVDDVDHDNGNDDDATTTNIVNRSGHRSYCTSIVQYHWIPVGFGMIPVVVKVCPVKTTQIDHTGIEYYNHILQMWYN